MILCGFPLLSWYLGACSSDASHSSDPNHARKALAMQGVTESSTHDDSPSPTAPRTNSSCAAFPKEDLLPTALRSPRRTDVVCMASMVSCLVPVQVMKPHHFGGNAKFRAVAQVDGMDEDFYSDAYSNGNSDCMRASFAADSYMVFTC